MDGNDFGMLRASVKAILEGPDRASRQWTVQGFGMMRCYFDGHRYRLNIWNPELTVPDVSVVHDHPWDFRSVIIAGQFCNVRFHVTPFQLKDTWQLPAPAQGCEGLYNFDTIITGPNGGPTGEVGTLYLKPKNNEHYSPGMAYNQEASEVHASYYRPGTVTLNDRTNRNGEKARVFWRAGTDWVDAKPRTATQAEVKRTLALALDQFTKSRAGD